MQTVPKAGRQVHGVAVTIHHLPANEAKQIRTKTSRHKVRKAVAINETNRLQQIIPTVRKPALQVTVEVKQKHRRQREAKADHRKNQKVKAAVVAAVPEVLVQTVVKQTRQQ